MNAPRKVAGKPLRANRARHKIYGAAPSLTAIVIIAGIVALITRRGSSVPPNQAPTQPPNAAPAPITRAIDLAAAYLEGSCNLTGRFAYRVDTKTGRQWSSYDIVRHAGAIYALAAYNNLRPDPKAVSAMVRAAGFTRTAYIGPAAGSNTLVVWSRPIPTKSGAALGASGLGLAALAAVNQAQPGTIAFDDLQALGRFILSQQRDDGSFASTYREDGRPASDWQSLYYPGEAALGLIALYQLDPSKEWLTAAGQALSYLVKIREGPRPVPPDHWTLIATARFLPYYDRVPVSASRAELIANAIRSSQSFLREQITNSLDERLNGGFDPGGGTTPTATRLEGLLAALEFLPEDQKELRTQIESAAEKGVAFLARAEITSGSFIGGLPQTALGSEMEKTRDSADVRIDYVQHALSAWVRYQRLTGPR